MPLIVCIKLLIHSDWCIQCLLLTPHEVSITNTKSYSLFNKLQWPNIGDAVGAIVGASIDVVVGASVGASVGLSVVDALGEWLGDYVGDPAGPRVAELVGAFKFSLCTGHILVMIEYAVK